MKKKRIIFALIFLLLVGLEFIIGIYFHDDFIRPFVGDVIIVIVIYSFVRVFVPQKAYWLSAAVFVFAALVEFSQIIPLCDLLGVRNNFLRVIMGVSFAWEDIICYAVGCAITAAYDVYIYNKERKR
ncbi:MAG: DUF2809 domain-containing protein [Clostridia bacterium]|nr:DUF2809 domain-containing protein [Clostridia bacterium]